MAESTPTPTPEGLGKLLSNPELIRKIGTIVGAPSDPVQSTPVSDGLSRVLSDPELMAKLPQIMEMLKPTIQSAPSDAAATSEALPVIAPNPIAPPHSHRDHLLLALKPFLSPERAATIDMLLRLERLESVLRTLK